MEAVGRSFAILLRELMMDIVNLYSLENYRVSLICSVSQINNSSLLLMI
jgi:hypothetical protein